MNFRCASIVLATSLSMSCLAHRAAAQDLTKGMTPKATASTEATQAAADAHKVRTKSNQTNERIVSEPAGQGIGASKYSAPINITSNTTIRVRVARSSPSPITETLYWVAGAIDGDGIAKNGILRVACRDKAVAFASFTKVGGELSAKRIETLMMSKSVAWDTSGALVGRDVEVVVQHPAARDKTMSVDDWHDATRRSLPQMFCS